MGATFARTKTWIAGETLTAADLNTEFNNILNNFDQVGIDDLSDTTSSMQTTVDPYPASSASLATDGAGELKRLRYVIAQITGEAYWYVDPDLALTALAIDAIWLPAYRWTPTTTAGCASLANVELATNDIQIEYLAFDGGSEEFCTLSLHMPEAWNRGTVKAKFFWIPATSCTAADTVEWEIAGVAVSNDDAIDAAPGTGQVISDVVTAGVEADLHISGATPAITIGGTPALGDLIHFKVSRNVGGTDDMEEDAWLLGVLIQYAKSNAVVAW